jgi:4-amino-4-deoxy-L-arabinose transferase-like glycosyltransferase
MPNEGRKLGSDARGRAAALWPFVAILLIALAARWVAFRGFAASDDADYARLAWAVAQGQIPPDELGAPFHYPTRLGVLMPVGGIFLLFGVHEWTLLLLPALMSAASLVLAYALARVFFSHTAGLVAMLLYAVLPIDCQFATWLLSDVPGAFWAGAGVLAVYLGSSAETTGRKVLAGAIAALCFGVAWITRTQVAQLAPFIAAALALWTWRDRRNAWMALVLAAGCLLVVGAEGWLYLRTRGDFLFNFHAAERMYAEHRQWYFTEGGVYGWEPGRYGFGLARRLLKTGPSEIFLNPNFAFVPLVALTAALHVALWRRREFLFPAAWFLWAVLIFNFGSASLKRYEPLPWINAYLVPIQMPAVVLAAGWLTWMLSVSAGDRHLVRERRFWGAMAAAVLALGVAAGLYHHHRQGIGCRVARAAAPELLQRSALPLYTDAMTLRAVEFFSAYNPPRPVRDLARLETETPPPGAAVFINRDELRRMNDQTGYRPPPCVDRPPANWKLERRWPDAELYIVM